MLARRIIPCLDVKDGRVVKGINFLELRDAGDPVEQAAAYDAQGADEICYLDISASPEGRSTLVDVVARTADQVFAPLTVGGGVRSVADAERLLEAGADKIAMNTAAIRDPDLVMRCAARFGTQAIVVAVETICSLVTGALVCSSNIDPPGRTKCNRRTARIRAMTRRARPPTGVSR